MFCESIFNNFPLFADHPQLHAQVPAPHAHRASQRHLHYAVELLQHLHLRGDHLHWCHGLSERAGKERIMFETRYEIIFIMIYNSFLWKSNVLTF